MTKSEKTRAYIIEQAAPVFNRKGYAETSLTDIIQATSLTKGAIYGNFTDKNEVAAAVYKYHIDRLIKNISVAVSGQENAYDKLLAYSGFYRNNWKQIFETGGCPVLNAAVEADDHLEFLKSAVQQSIKRWIRNIVKIIEQGQEEGVLRADADAEFYATTFITIQEGGIMLAKIMNNHQYLLMALDRLELIIKQELKS